LGTPVDLCRLGKIRMRKSFGKKLFGRHPAGFQCRKVGFGFVKVEPRNGNSAIGHDGLQRLGRKRERLHALTLKKIHEPAAASSAQKQNEMNFFNRLPSILHVSVSK
jgi:hypothetical protein